MTGAVRDVMVIWLVNSEYFHMPSAFAARLPTAERYLALGDHRRDLDVLLGVAR
jgi:hypothetical protein